MNSPTTEVIIILTLVILFIIGLPILYPWILVCYLTFKNHSHSEIDELELALVELGLLELELEENNQPFQTILRSG